MGVVEPAVRLQAFPGRALLNIHTTHTKGARASAGAAREAKWRYF